MLSILNPPTTSSSSKTHLKWNKNSLTTIKILFSSSQVIKTPKITRLFHLQNDARISRAHLLKFRQTKRSTADAEGLALVRFQCFLQNHPHSKVKMSDDLEQIATKQTQQIVIPGNVLNDRKKVLRNPLGAKSLNHGIQYGRHPALSRQVMD